VLDLIVDTAFEKPFLVEQTLRERSELLRQQPDPGYLAGFSIEMNHTDRVSEADPFGMRGVACVNVTARTYLSVSPYLDVTANLQLSLEKLHRLFEKCVDRVAGSELY
jgi:hypothetical protein